MGLIEELLKTFPCLHFSLIDPEDQTPVEAGQRANLCEKFGTNAIMVGGSTVTQRQHVYDTIHHIKKNIGIPVILFPNSSVAISKNADYIFFMELLNSMDYRYRGGEQLEGAFLIKKWGIKPISMGYIVISTSAKPTTLETRTKLDRITSEDVEKVVKYAVYAEMRGMSCVYLEAGSNPDHPVGLKTIQAVRQAIEIPLIIGGGINTPILAKERVEAGADVIVNGTATEKNILIIREIIREIRGPHTLSNASVA